MSSAKFPTRVAFAIVAGVVASLICFALAIMTLKDRSNDQARAESVELVATLLANMHRDLAAVTLEYNVWAEAYHAMMRGDLTWIHENYAASAVNGVAFDSVVLFDGPFREPLGWTAVAPAVEPSPSHLSADLLAHVAAGVGGQPLSEQVTFDAFTVVDGRLALVSATQVRPLEPSEPLDPADLPVAVFTKTLDEDGLAALANALLVDAVTFNAHPVPGLASLAVAGPDGGELGHLSWAPPRPGSEIVATMAPVLVAAGLAFAVLGAAAAWLVGAHARHLVWERTEASRLARVDGMTGVANRLAFAEHLARLGEDRAAQVAVLFLDLNGFKTVNDTLGHAAGDALVAGVAQRLGRLSGDGVFLARLGGDEFAFIVSGAAGVAARVGALTEEVSAAMAEPLRVLGENLYVSASQGLALRDGPDVPLDEVVRRADQAMYRAKRARAAHVRAVPRDLDEGFSRGAQAVPAA